MAQGCVKVTTWPPSFWNSSARTRGPPSPAAQLLLPDVVVGVYGVCFATAPILHEHHRVPCCVGGVAVVHLKRHTPRRWRLANMRPTIAGGPVELPNHPPTQPPPPKFNSSASYWGWSICSSSDALDDGVLGHNMLIGWHPSFETSAAVAASPPLIFARDPASCELIVGPSGSLSIFSGTFPVKLREGNQLTIAWFPWFQGTWQICGFSAKIRCAVTGACASFRTVGCWGSPPSEKEKMAGNHPKKQGLLLSP